MYGRDGYGQLGDIRAAYMTCFEHRTAKRPARAEYCFGHWLDLHLCSNEQPLGYLRTEDPWTEFLIVI
jgi:hypothetical protein